MWLQVGPLAMSGDGGGLRNDPAHLEQMHDAFMAQIVEMQISMPSSAQARVKKR